MPCKAAYQIRAVNRVVEGASNLVPRVRRASVDKRPWARG